MIKGIDTSIWQGNWEVKLLEPEIKFIIIKATEGRIIDGKFKEQQAKIRSSDKILGYYHFAQFDLGKTDSGIREADHFIDTVKPAPGEFLCLDIEQGAENYKDECYKFVKRVEERIPGYKCLVYMNLTTARQKGWKPIIDNDNGLWLAYYRYNDGTFSKPSGLGDWKFIAMEQYTSVGKSQAIKGNLDMDVFMGDESQLRKYCIQASKAEPISITESSQPEDANTNQTVTYSQDDVDKLKLEFQTNLDANLKCQSDEFEKRKHELDNALADANYTLEQLNNKIEEKEQSYKDEINLLKETYTTQIESLKKDNEKLQESDIDTIIQNFTLSTAHLSDNPYVRRLALIIKDNAQSMITSVKEENDNLKTENTIKDGTIKVLENRLESTVKSDFDKTKTAAGYSGLSSIITSLVLHALSIVFGTTPDAQLTLNSMMYPIINTTINTWLQMINNWISKIQRKAV